LTSELKRKVGVRPGRSNQALPMSPPRAKQRPLISLVNKGNQGPHCMAVTVGFEPISSSPQFRGKSRKALVFQLNGGLLVTLSDGRRHHFTAIPLPILCQSGFAVLWERRPRSLGCLRTCHRPLQRHCSSTCLRCTLRPPAARRSAYCRSADRCRVEIRA
jgi:hypothetical protein